MSKLTLNLSPSWHYEDVLLFVKHEFNSGKIEEFGLHF